MYLLFCNNVVLRRFDLYPVKEHSHMSFKPILLYMAPGACIRSNFKKCLNVIKHVARAFGIFIKTILAGSGLASLIFCSSRVSICSHDGAAPSWDGACTVWLSFVFRRSPLRAFVFEHRSSSLGTSDIFGGLFLIRQLISHILFLFLFIMSSNGFQFILSTKTLCLLYPALCLTRKFKFHLIRSTSTRNVWFTDRVVSN